MKLICIKTNCDNPYRNLALEEYLLEHVDSEECILYLWQNRNTVVIGKNQDAYKECRVSELSADEGRLARRLSGGGAVYHDMGNLNFTFITREQHYSVEKQLSVICEAVRSFGIDAQKSGRNDICIDERKFSGNAFLKQKDRCYHHGTLLVNVDMSKLSTYLNVSQSKLQSKGVSSVKSRVVNLSELNSQITIESMGAAVCRAFEQVYGSQIEYLMESEINQAELEQLQARYESAEWLFSKRIQTNYTIEKRFIWGEVSIHLEIVEGMIKQVKVYSDAMEAALAGYLEACLVGLRFDKAELSKKLMAADCEYRGMTTELGQYIAELEL